MADVDALELALGDERQRAAILADPPGALRRYGLTLDDLEALGRHPSAVTDRASRAVLFALLAHVRGPRDDAPR